MSALGQKQTLGKVRLMSALPLPAPHGGQSVRRAVQIPKEHANADYELVFQTGPYFVAQSLPQPIKQIEKQVVIRFAMPDPNASYHIPLMIAPNSYSVWWSS